MHRPDYQPTDPTMLTQILISVIIAATALASLYLWATIALRSIFAQPTEPLITDEEIYEICYAALHLDGRHDQ